MKSWHFMDGAREFHAKQNKSVRESQIPYDLTHIFKKQKEWAKGKKRERQTKKEIPTYRE